MLKKILVCGGSGFIGKNLCIQLSKKKVNLTATYFSKKPKLNIKNIKWIKCDLRLLDDCIKVTKNKDIIIQCAATTSGSNDIIKSPYLHVTDNAIINSYLLKASYINNIKHFIFTSCTVMYKNSKISLKENQVDINKIYKTYFGVAHTKLYIEKMCKFFSSISKIKFSIIRHSNIYGPYDKFDEKKGHFIGSTIYKIFNLNKLIINGKGNEKRDFLYIDDFLNFINSVIKKQRSKFEIYNCSYGKSFKIKKILEKIIKISNYKKKIIYNNNAKNINVNILVNSNKAKKELSWFPKIKIDNGLTKAIEWYKKKYDKKIL